MSRDDDDRPRRHHRLQPPVLDSLSVKELGLYVEELNAEIARVEAEINRKRAHQSAADAFFRRPAAT